MFAVPGWKVPAKSLVQEKAQTTKKGSKASTDLQQSNRENDSLKPSNGLKKRKRENASNTDIDLTRSSSRKVSRSEETHDGRKKQQDRGPSRDKRKRNGNRKGDPKAQFSGANSEPVGLPRSSQHAGGIGNAVSADGENATMSLNSLPPIMPANSKLTPLQAKMRAKLTSARFRHLNETLYTNSSAHALQLFTDSPDLFTEYHAGFSQQVKDSWPQNPVDVYVGIIQERAPIAAPNNGKLPLPRRRPGTCNIADLGCGDAPLARGVQKVARKFDIKLHSFDLQAPNEFVTKADISALPLHDGQVDVAIFCLSLMGTNWLSFVEEAWRVMRGDGKGELWVAEVKSRFGRLSEKKGAGKVVENSVGKRRKAPSGKADVENEQAPNFVEEERGMDTPGADDDTDLQPFMDCIQRRGFVLREGSVDKSNKMFVSMIFTKAGTPRVGKWKGMKWNGKEYQLVEDKKPKRFQVERNSRFAQVEEENDQDEGKILKPCVYKLR